MTDRIQRKVTDSSKPWRISVFMYDVREEQFQREFTWASNGEDKSGEAGPTADINDVQAVEVRIHTAAGTATAVREVVPTHGRDDGKRILHMPRHDLPLVRDRRQVHALRQEPAIIPTHQPSIQKPQRRVLTWFHSSRARTYRATCSRWEDDRVWVTLPLVPLQPPQAEAMGRKFAAPVLGADLKRAQKIEQLRRRLRETSRKVGAGRSLEPPHSEDIATSREKWRHRGAYRRNITSEN